MRSEKAAGRPDQEGGQDPQDSVDPAAAERRGDRARPRRQGFEIPDTSSLRGLWTRSMILLPDGTLDATTRVSWLQGVSLFVDLRRPASLPDFSHAGCLNELTMADCRALATQEGFAGVFSHLGGWFEWARMIDFQPKSLYADVGSLCWKGNGLVEEGRDVAYTEHWHRPVPADDGPAYGLSLLDAVSGTRGCLVRVGETFMIARDRHGGLPPHRSLAECVGEVATLAEARALLDCEISLGSVADGRFRIVESSLPYRVGDCLAPRREDGSVRTSDRDPDGRMFERKWTPVLEEGDPAFSPVKGELR